MTNFDLTEEEIQACRPDSIGLARALLKVARDESLPGDYRHQMASLASEIYAGLLDENDPRVSFAKCVVAYTSPDTSVSEKQEAYARVIELESVDLGR